MTATINSLQRLSEIIAISFTNNTFFVDNWLQSFIITKLKKGNEKIKKNYKQCYVLKKMFLTIIEDIALKTH